MSEKETDGLAIVAGQPIEIELDGKMYKIHPPTLGDLAALTAYIRQVKTKEAQTKLTSYLEMLKTANAPQDIQSLIIKELMQGSVEDDDIVAQLNSTEGTSYMLWLCLKKGEPKLTLNQVSEMVKIGDMPNINKIIMQLMFGKLMNKEKLPIPENPPKEI